MIYNSFFFPANFETSLYDGLEAREKLKCMLLSQYLSVHCNSEIYMGTVASSLDKTKINCPDLMALGSTMKASVFIRYIILTFLREATLPTAVLLSQTCFSAMHFGQ